MSPIPPRSDTFLKGGPCDFYAFLFMVGDDTYQFKSTLPRFIHTGIKYHIYNQNQKNKLGK